MNKIIYTLLFVTFFIVISKCDEASFAQDICTNKTGDPEFYQTFLDSFINANRCYENLLNFSAIYYEAQELGPLGRMDELYNKTCQKQDGIIQCFKSESVILNACFTEQQILEKDLMIRALRRAMSYACGTDGDTIALFINKLGPECFDQQQRAVKKCLTVSQKYSDSNPFSPSTYINDDTCGDLKNLRNCLIPSLEKCPHPEVANIVNGLINVLLDVLSCETN